MAKITKTFTFFSFSFKALFESVALTAKKSIMLEF